MILYKFIWNRHYLASKAPERIKRDIVNKPIKLGGLGMLNIRELDTSLKLRVPGRLLVTKHPFLMLVRNKINLADFISPKISTALDEVSAEGIKILLEDRKKLFLNDRLDRNTYFISALRRNKIKSVLSRNGLNSLAWFNLRVLGKTTVANLTPNELASLTPFIERNLFDRLVSAINLNINTHLNQDLGTMYVTGDRFSPLEKLTSKEFRISRSDSDPITNFKIGPNLTKASSVKWAFVVNKLTSIKHKDLILRLAHGELYSKERLHRYLLIDNAQCPRCDEIETIRHKYFECSYIKEIWRRTFLITNKLRLRIQPNETTIERVLCCTNEPNLTSLTIHAEIINRIRQLKDTEANLLLWPKLFVKKAGELLLRREQNQTVKNSLIDLFSD